ncbi:hypothetical protein T08_8898, partial [Trichinella sp. T8]
MSLDHRNLLPDFQDFRWSHAQLIELFKEPIQAFLADDQLLRFFSCSSRHHCSSRSIQRSLALKSGSEDQMLATTICQLAVD